MNFFENFIQIWCKTEKEWNRSFSIKLVENNPNISEEEIRKGLEGNICRCTGYHNIVKSVKQASTVMGG